MILKQFHTAILYNILVCEAIQQHLLKYCEGHTLAVSALWLHRFIHLDLVYVYIVGLKPVTLHKGVYLPSVCLCYRAIVIVLCSHAD